MKRLLLGAMVALLAYSANAQPCANKVDIKGLPLETFPATGGKSDLFAVMLSGDGGWRSIDEHVTDPLRAAGIPVVGFMTPPFFEERKTPEESACALERVIRYYAAAWHRDRVVLLGYSRGADVLPFLVSRLPAELRAKVRLTVFMGLESTIDFKYHSPWGLGRFIEEPQFPVHPEVEKLRGSRMLCVYGLEESDALCKKLDAGLVKAVSFPGTHHFDGRYAEIGALILKELAAK
jgi:type IV secretory pathway VirJ component